MLIIVWASELSPDRTSQISGPLREKRTTLMVSYWRDWRKVDLVKKGEKREYWKSAKRTKTRSFWLLCKPQFNLGHYELRYSYPNPFSESRKNVTKRTLPGRDSETAIKEELNATNIVFVQTCREHRSLSNYPANPAKTPRESRRHRRTFAKFAGKPEIRGRMMGEKGGEESNPDHSLNSTAPTMLIWQGERERNGSGVSRREKERERGSRVKWSGKSSNSFQG